MSVISGNAEEVVERPFNLRLMLRLLTYLRSYKKRVAVALALIIVEAFSFQLGPRLTQIGVDDYILKGDLQGLHWIVALFFASLGLQYIARLAQTMVTQLTGQLVMRDLRRQIFLHLQRLPLQYFDRTPVGRTMTRTTNDVEALNEFFTEGVVSVFLDLFTIIAIVAFMADMDWQLTLVSCTVIPFLVVATFYLQGMAMKAFRELRRRLARLNAYLQENITGVEVIQLFNRGDRNQLDLDAEHLPYRNAQDREIRYFAIFFPFAEFVGTVGMALVIYYGAGSVLEGRIDVGVLVAFLQYIRRFFRPIMDISDRYALLQSAMAASERIFELLDTETEVNNGHQRSGVPDSECVIEFDRVWFKYDLKSNGHILKDVSFRVKTGESLAIVGATGSGKTTIVNLLCRFYEIQSGAIRVDGVDVRDWELEALRQRIGIVQQDVFLFTDDVIGNIRVNPARTTSQTAIDTARYVNADRFIERLPDGFTHAVAEGGSSLSVGQRQLLSFARALATDPEILILDEATANIDTETEHLIQGAIGKIMNQRTSIVIAHRLSTIRNADNILVLHQGEIRERGHHVDLINQGGIYARLYRLNYNPKVGG